jgi:hypothetical protein
MTYYPPNYPPQFSAPAAPPPQDKSVGAALVLTLFFGPFGLFYLGAIPGIVGLFVLIPLAIIGGLVTYGLAAFVVYVGTIIWACARAGRDHSTFLAYLARGAR